LGWIEWVFSGIGVFLLSFLFVKSNNKKQKQIQKVNKRATGIQVGGDFNIGDKDGKK
jgi:cytochrome oxidase Cu insertion factor (SCO1/SenC/PrrC family)